MTTLALASGSADRLVSVGAFAIRPVVYRGTVGGNLLLPPPEPIPGLRLTLASSGRASIDMTRSPLRGHPAIFHASTNCYGFLDVGGGAHRVHVVDPARRFSSRAVEVDAPDRLPLGEALARGASVLPAVASPPLRIVPLRRAPGSPLEDAETARWGSVRDSSGKRIPFAWVGLDTPQGSYVTWSDARGEYLAVLSFLEPVVLVPPDDDEDAPELETVFSTKVRAYRPLAAPPDPLSAFPADFDDLAPGTARFGEIYDTTPVFDASLDIEVRTKALLDLQ